MKLGFFFFAFYRLYIDTENMQTWFASVVRLFFIETSHVRLTSTMQHYTEDCQFFIRKMLKSQLINVSDCFSRLTVADNLKCEIAECELVPIKAIAD